ncbi:ornithine cyclodeaminase [Pectobacterium polonicum]|uniref:ornithine cyclodeaminase n=1 Tax=Pectobacterium polonicum TaxID=2485124 RepID=UPI0037552CFF
MQPSLRYLDRHTVQQLGGTDPLNALQDIRTVTQLMRQGEARMPAETHVDLATPSGKAYALPAGVGGRFNAAGVKWTAHRPQARDALPQALAVTLINRLSDGLPLGIVESASLTAVRTAAVSALALRHAAPRPVRRILLMGAGVQAQAHLEMLRVLFPTLENVVWWNRSEERLLRTMENTPTLPWPIDIPTTLQQALQTDYDALLTCTSAPLPFIGAETVRDGTIVLQIGYHEMQFAGIRHATKVVVDAWGDFCQSSAKSLFQMYRAGAFHPSEVSADLEQLLLDPWQSQANDRVYFSSFGLNVFDIALAARVLQDAERQNVGTLLPLFSGLHHVD